MTGKRRQGIGDILRQVYIVSVNPDGIS